MKELIWSSFNYMYFFSLGATLICYSSITAYSCMNGIYMYMYMHVYVYMYFHDTCTLYVCMSGKLVHMISVSLGCISKLFLTITNVSEQKQLLCYSLMATFEHKRLSNRSVVDKLFIGCYAW